MIGAALTRLGGFGLLANPWVLLAVGLALAGSHTYMYVQGRADGGNKEALKCEVRVAKLQGEYAEQAKRIDELNRVWKEALDAFIEGEAKRAEDRQKELDEANAKIDDYISKLGTAKKACLLDDDDLGTGGVQHRP